MTPPNTNPEWSGNLPCVDVEAHGSTPAGTSGNPDQCGVGVIHSHPVRAGNRGTSLLDLPEGFGLRGFLQEWIAPPDSRFADRWH